MQSGGRDLWGRGPADRALDRAAEARTLRASGEEKSRFPRDFYDVESIAVSRRSAQFDGGFLSDAGARHELSAHEQRRAVGVLFDVLSEGFRPRGVGENSCWPGPVVELDVRVQPGKPVALSSAFALVEDPALCRGREPDRVVLDRARERCENGWSLAVAGTLSSRPNGGDVIAPGANDDDGTSESELVSKPGDLRGVRVAPVCQHRKSILYGRSAHFFKRHTEISVLGSPSRRLVVVRVQPPS